MLFIFILLITITCGRNKEFPVQMSAPLCINRQSSSGVGKRHQKEEEKSHSQGLVPIDNREHEGERRLLVKEQAAFRVLSSSLTKNIYTEIGQRNLPENGGSLKGPDVTFPTFR